MPNTTEITTLSSEVLTTHGVLVDELRTFVVENFLFGQDASRLTADSSFIDNGILDSTGLLELIGFIERTYEIRLADDELIPDNLDSLNKLANFVSWKRMEHR